MWCVKWRGESELSTAHSTQDTDQDIQLVNRLEPAWLHKKETKGKTRFHQKWVKSFSGVSRGFQVTVSDNCLCRLMRLCWILNDKPDRAHRVISLNPVMFFFQWMWRNECSFAFQLVCYFRIDPLVSVLESRADLVTFAKQWLKNCLNKFILFIF